MISLSFSLSNRRPKDTRDNILNSKEFTVSIISEPFVEAANSTSVESSADHDEWIFSGLTKESSVSFDSDLLAYYNNPPERLTAPGWATLRPRKCHMYGMRGLLLCCFRLTINNCSEHSYTMLRIFVFRPLINLRRQWYWVLFERFTSGKASSVRMEKPLDRKSVV